LLVLSADEGGGNELGLGVIPEEEKKPFMQALLEINDFKYLKFQQMFMRSRDNDSPLLDKFTSPGFQQIASTPKQLSYMFEYYYSWLEKNPDPSYPAKSNACIKIIPMVEGSIIAFHGIHFVKPQLE